MRKLIKNQKDLKITEIKFDEMKKIKGGGGEGENSFDIIIILENL